MTLTTDAKNFIASALGSGNCFASSGVRYTDPLGGVHSGSTYNVVKTMKLGGKGPGGEWFDDIPDYRQITDPDISWISGASYCVGGGSTTPPPATGGCTLGTRRCNGNNVEVCMTTQGGPNRWVHLGNCEFGCSGGRCLTETTTPPPETGGCTLGARRCNGRAVEECVSVYGGDNRWDYMHTCEYGCTGAGICTQASSTPSSGSQDGTGPFEVTVGGATGTSCESGDPNATLDVSDAYAYYKSEPTAYIGVMGIMVTNHNNEDCYAYFAWEMRMWDGHGYTTCPASSPEVIEISRFLAEVSTTKDITMKKVLANQTEMIGGSFEIPSTAEGKKTVCLTLWGNYSYPALVDELEAAGYAQSIPW